MEILRVEDLTFEHALSKEKALENISFTLNQGEFVALCGATGSGKSTLLRLIKRELAPAGKRDGKICLFGAPIEELDPVTSASSIGYVMQRPEQQIVTDKVWHELAFGPESLGTPQQVIRRRVAETASFFGISEWFDAKTDELSGGQKQLLCLASVLTGSPELLLLDEPTSQLDPIAASDFISTIRRINRELGITVLIAEHRMEEVLPLADRVIILNERKVVFDGDPRAAAVCAYDIESLSASMPSASRIYCALTSYSRKERSQFEKSITSKCPLGIREGREFIESSCFSSEKNLSAMTKSIESTQPEPALEFRNVYFKYAKTMPDVLHDLTFTVFERELFCILGPNGSGKSTALSAAAGLIKPYMGKIKLFGQNISAYGVSLRPDTVVMLPQDVQTCFTQSTVRLELSETAAENFPFDFEAMLDKHPYDLSGGEQQMVALAKATAAHPRVLLMDEPTKGLDAAAKSHLADFLRYLTSSGTTVIVVTHDVEFAADCADRCALFFRGETISVEEKQKFFSSNLYYTTAVSRMARKIDDTLISVNDAVTSLRLKEVPK